MGVKTFPKHFGWPGSQRENDRRVTGLVRVTGLEGGFIKPLVIFGVKCAQINEKKEYYFELQCGSQSFSLRLAFNCMKCLKKVRRRAPLM